MALTKTKKKVGGAYVEAVGRRKTSVARVRLYSAEKDQIIVNDKTLENYFPTNELQQAATAPLAAVAPRPAGKVEVKVNGGGISSQAGAIALGLARVLVKNDATQRTLLKTKLFLRRDSRMKERRKFGLKKARKSPQWSKR
ncbi:MAG: 30S ribosomal protein S9 [Patescibacteria group bacterium]